jgi:hypothetical protein
MSTHGPAARREVTGARDDRRQTAYQSNVNGSKSARGVVPHSWTEIHVPVQSIYDHGTYSFSPGSNRNDQQRYGNWGILSSICRSLAYTPVALEILRQQYRLLETECLKVWTLSGAWLRGGGTLHHPLCFVRYALCGGLVALAGVHLAPLFPCRFRNVDSEKCKTLGTRSLGKTMTLYGMPPILT